MKKATPPKLKALLVDTPTDTQLNTLKDIDSDDLDKFIKYCEEKIQSLSNKPDISKLKKQLELIMRVQLLIKGDRLNKFKESCAKHININSSITSSKQLNDLSFYFEGYVRYFLLQMNKN